jgi:hypothetical protein
MAPRTREEDELMGDARDRLVNQAKAKGAEKLEQASGKPTVRGPPSDVPMQPVPPAVGADLTPRGPGGARGKP